MCLSGWPPLLEPPPRHLERFASSRSQGLAGGACFRNPPLAAGSLGSLGNEAGGKAELSAVA